MESGWKDERIRAAAQDLLDDDSPFMAWITVGLQAAAYLSVCYGFEPEGECAEYVEWVTSAYDAPR